MPKPIRCVRCTKAVLRNASDRDKNPSLYRICLGDSPQRSPNAPKETERQEHWAREAGWKLAKKILKLKEEQKTTFFSPTEKWCLPSPYKIEPEERDFMVDSGASMHLIGRKDLNSAELGTLTTSRIPTTDITATGEVQTHVEAKVYVMEWDIFLTLKILEETQVVLSLRKLCENH